MKATSIKNIIFFLFLCATFFSTIASLSQVVLLSSLTIKFAFCASFLVLLGLSNQPFLYFSLNKSGKKFNCEIPVVFAATHQYSNCKQTLKDMRYKP